MNPFKKAVDRWLGRGEASITMPPMDGAFRPNDLLDSAPTIVETPAPDCLAATSHGLSSPRSVRCSASTNRAARRSRPSMPRSARLAGLPDGGAAVGLIDGRIVFVGGEHGGKTIAAGPEVKCITALAPARGRNAARRQRLGVERAGRLEARPDGEERLRVGVADRSSERRPQATGRESWLTPMAFSRTADSVVVSESWRSALTRISPGASGRNESVLENLPAYPSRLSRGADNAIWLALFAPRRQLVEFVLSEDRYRRRMIDEIDPDYWIAPCLRAGRTPLEPTQQGGVRQFGLLKPWSPSRSYGLVARLDHRLSPDASLHSRANGRRHGVTCCLAFDGRLFISAPKAMGSSPRALTRD